MVYGIERQGFTHCALIVFGKNRTLRQVGLVEKVTCLVDGFSIHAAVDATSRRACRSFRLGPTPPSPRGPWQTAQISP
jgi:hypothetical protein